MARSLFFAILIAASALAGAQSRFSYALASAGNQAYTDGQYGYNASFTDGSLASIDSNKSWTNGSGQTMTLAAMATGSANYGRLRTGASGMLSNTLYDPSQSPYWDGTTLNDDGVADSFLVASAAGFSDLLSFGAGANATYKAKYIFHIDGFAQGEGTSANLRVNIANNGFVQHDVDLSSGFVSEDWATDSYTVGALLNQTADVQFTTRFDATTYDYALLDGSTVMGSANFTSTITLTRIDVFDAFGNQVFNVPITGASGTVYAAGPVPEPASLVTIGLGVVGLLRRRRR